MTRAPSGPQFVLTGVVIAGETRMALLQEPALTQNGPRVVQLGESVAAYVLAAVEQDRVTLRGPGGDLMVVLGGGAGAVPGPPLGPRVPASAASVPPQVTGGESNQRAEEGVPQITGERGGKRGGGGRAGAKREKQAKPERGKGKRSPASGDQDQ